MRNAAIRLLLVESSPTLRYGLRKLLQRHGFDVIALADYDTGIARLEDEFAAGLTGVVLGWPLQPSAAFERLVERLKTREYQRLVVAVMTQDTARVSEGHLGERPHTLIERWQRYGELPRLLRHLLAQQARGQSDALSAAPLKVLLVDDSRTVRINYLRLLESHGYAVTAAESAEEAQELATRDSFDIAIIDYFMPGANGAMLCRAFRENPATSHLILAILTGTYQERVVSDCLAAGAQECMFKTESRELFLARIHNLARMLERERRIERERTRLQGILASVGDGVFGVDTQGQISFINPAALRLLHLGHAAEVVGQKAHDLFHFADENGRRTEAETCFLQQAYELGDSLSNWETVFWRADGHSLSVECTLQPLKLDGERIGSVVAFRDISERKLFEEELKWQVHHDHLTQLLNRPYFEEALEQEVLRLKRSAETSALLFIDLDRFKQINDTAGHAAGDQLLITISQKLKSRLRRTDLLARLGGDEFAVLLRNLELEHLLELAEQFRAILDDTRFIYDGREFDISGSVGITLLDCHTLSPARAMNHADAACQIAKRKGRNQVHLFNARDDSAAVAALDKSWSERLEQALAEDGFELYFQPIFALDALDTEMSGKTPVYPASAIRGYEVLLRLREGEQLLSPRAFLTQAERFELLPRLDAWCLAHLARLLEEYPLASPRFFNVNTSPGSLLDPAYRQQLLGLRHSGRFADGQLRLELKETAVMTPMSSLLPVVHELAEAGIEVVLEDFGRGIGTFAYLKKLPVGAVKIDGSVVQAMSHDVIGETMVRAVTEVAHALGKPVVAPQVEDVETLRLLRLAGVDFAQGWVLARPSRDWPMELLSPASS